MRQFKQRGLLFPGSNFTWRWHYGSGGESAGSIGVRIEQHQLALMFSANGTYAGHTVELDRTPCNFGGFRPWFRCPHCARRAGVLFLRGKTFMCRRCGGVKYSSQSDDRIGRTWRRQYRLEARLGENWARPKGMHHKTRTRLLDRIWQCEEVRDEAIEMFMLRAFRGAAD